MFVEGLEGGQQRGVGICIDAFHRQRETLTFHPHDPGTERCAGFTGRGFCCTRGGVRLTGSGGWGVVTGGVPLTRRKVGTKLQARLSKRFGEICVGRFVTFDVLLATR